MRFAINFSCCLLATLILFLFSFASYAEQVCEVGNLTSPQTWSGNNYGDNPSLCLLGCEYRRYGGGISSLCYVSSGDCRGSFISTGGTCTKDGLFFGGNKPNTIPNPKPEPNPDDTPNSTTAKKWDHPSYYRCFPAENGNISCSGLGGAFAQLDTALNKKIDNQTYDLKNVLLESRDKILDHIFTSNMSVNQEVNETKAIAAETSQGVKKLDTDLDSVDKKLDQLTQNTTPKGLSEAILNSVQSQASRLNSNINSSLDTTMSYLGSKFGEQNQLINGNQRELLSRLDNINRNVNNKAKNINGNIDGLETAMNANFSDLNAKLDKLGNGSGGDSDGIIGAINGVGQKVDGLGTSLTDIGQSLEGIHNMLGGEALTKGEHSSIIDFNSLPLYQPSEIDRINNEVEGLKTQYSQKINDFKNLFSFDSRTLNNGEFVEHKLNFSFANGANLSASSSVFPALVRNSGTISAVILFIAVIAGLRVVMGAKN
ncbi:hypothetical protein OC519_06825 [Vibrio vulnificus]|nr:hypothetical protein [Vibrio vulnificus]